MDLSYAEIVGRGVALPVDEAAGLVLAAARALQAATSGDAATTLPPLDCIVVNRAGHVTLLPCGDVRPDDPVRQLGAMLHAFLVPEGAAHARVPGPLMLLAARAAGGIDLPRPSLAEVERVLSRFGSSEPAILSSVYRRCVRRPVVQESLTARVTPVSPRPSSPLHEPRDDDRLRTAVVAAATVAVLTLLVIANLLFFTWRSEHGDASRSHQVEVTQPVSQTTPSREPAPRAERSPEPAAARDGEPAPLLTASLVGADVFSPSFSNTGNEVVFHAGRMPSALMRASLDAHGQPIVVPLVRDGAANFHATMSPDGRWLAYDSDRDGTRGVYIAHADGSEPQKVSGDRYAAVPHWSPDGARLAFLRAESRRPRVWNVWIFDVGTRAMTRVSRHSVGQAWGASWFPDGNRIAYSVEDRLVIADLRDGTTRTVRSPVRGRLVRTPAVSPDGRSIVFQVYRDGVWLLNVASGVTRRVLADRAAEEFAWAPDGARVVYHTRRNGAWSLWQLPLERTGA
jgi:Tol biopolymer transport system component